MVTTAARVTGIRNYSGTLGPRIRNFGVSNPEPRRHTATAARLRGSLGRRVGVGILSVSGTLRPLPELPEPRFPREVPEVPEVPEVLNKTHTAPQSKPHDPHARYIGAIAPILRNFRNDGPLATSFITSNTASGASQ